MLEIVADFSLVWLLSPALNLRPIPTGKLARTIATLPGHASQKGAFALWQRASTIAYRAAQFFCVGMVSTMVSAGPAGDVSCRCRPSRLRDGRPTCFRLAALHCCNGLPLAVPIRARLAREDYVERWKDKERDRERER